MARGDLLLALVGSGAGGNELAFRRAAEALIAEEEAKKQWCAGFSVDRSPY
jgi:hypothetical protein